jgi:tetratricopeptide (TPR) repeat protein
MASMSLQAAYDQARQWLESNDLNRAIGLAQYILEHYPDNLDAYRILGEAYLANRQLDRAQEAFERVLRSDPENIPAHVGLGITYERQGRLDLAIPEFEQALEVKPDMPELRSQLLRLYTEAWGSEHAHLRLSRAGLARLYAKGHMLPQAIGEFRQVIADQPDRLDATVAMAEALWRDGQEEEAVGLCRRILAQRPESLKANLILGYLEMAAGNPEGERAWETARRMDPYQVVARAVFDTLPPESAQEPSIDEWDEQAWRQRRAEEEQERIAATRPMEAVTPVAIPVDSGANGARQVAPPPPTPPRAVPTMADSDDFLASLLAINTAPSSPAPLPTPVSAPEEDDDLDLGMAPFSLADLDSADAQFPPAPPARAADARSAEDEPALTPFSLNDLGLTDEEVAGLESLNEAPAADAPAPAEDTDEPALTPFSLSDLGLTDEEIASLEGGSAPSEAPMRAAAPVESREPALTPFSLNDLGLTDDEIAGLNVEGDRPDTRGRTGVPDHGYDAVPDASEQVFDTSDLPMDLQPFSLDELDLNVGSTETNTGGLGSSLQPFSFDESPPQRPRVSGFMADEGFEASSEEQENISDTGGFSWQQPSQKPQPGFLKSIRSEPEATDSSIFSKLKQRHEREDKIPPPPLPIDEEEHLGLFSMDDIPLRLDEEPDAQALAEVPMEEVPPAVPPAAPPTPAAPVEAESLQEAIDAGQVQPFSLADLGLSEEEIAALGLSDAPPATPDAAEAAVPAAPEADIGRGAMHSLDDLEPVAPEAMAADAPVEARTSESDESALSGELQPFSLADLGLSDEEITALGLDVSTEPEEPIASELGITEEELEGLNLGDLSWDQPTPVHPPAEPARPPMQTTSGDLLVDRLIALGHEQGYVDISDIIATFENPEAEAERIEEIGRRLHEAQIEIRDGDEVIDMDADYSEEEELPTYTEEAEQPAYVEPVPAETAPVESAEKGPALMPFSLSELGLSAEEIAALELSETPAAEEPAREDEEPVMTPFSLSELGLSAEEIAALGLGETPVAEEAPAHAEEEPVMTPFSLSELGLSAEEIAALELSETPTPAEAAVPEPAAEEPAREDEEPVMTPFSLSELGLSAEEIAALGLGETPTPAEAAVPEPAASATPEEPPTASAPPPEPPHVVAPQVTSEPARPAVTTPPPSAPPPPTPAAPAATPSRRPAARPRAEPESPAASGNDLLDAYLHRLESDPQNYALRLSVARVGGQLGMAEFALQQYRYLIKQSILLDQIEDDIQDLILDADDRQILRRLHRSLGDVYTKQGRLAEAIDEYSWTPAGS